MADDPEGYYVIKSTCASGCPNHLPGEWYKSHILSGLDKAEAEAEFDAHAARYWRSKPYKLVWITPEVVTPEVETVVKEIPRT